MRIKLRHAAGTVGLAFILATAQASAASAAIIHSYEGQSLPKTEAITSVATRSSWELARRDRIRAYRDGRNIRIVAEGELPTPCYDVDIAPSPLKIYPQQFNLLWRERPGICIQRITPYRYEESFRFPVNPRTVTVRHATGQDRITIR